MSILGDIFSEVPKTALYHYTGIGGLIGIVEKDCLWASHIYYLNDSSEIVYACDILKRITRDFNLKKMFQYSEGGEPIGLLTPFLGWLDTFSREAYHLFLFSLTEEPNLLSQWRSYTPHGKGVSIGFSADVILKIVQKENFRIAKCIYDKKKQEEILSDFLSNLFIAFKQELVSSKVRKSLRSDYESGKGFNRFFEKFRGYSSTLRNN